MIVTEEVLRDLFDMIPEIQVNANNSIKPFYGWGKKEEINRYIKLYKSSNYPLIWLLPSKEVFNYSSNLVTKDVSLILATLETRDDLLNPQRYQGSYRSVLNPLTDYVIQALRNGNTTRVTSINIDIFKEPHYTDTEENGTIDKWDAVRIDCEVEFNTNCLKSIKWRK